MGVIKFAPAETAQFAPSDSSHERVESEDFVKRPVFGGPAELELFEIRGGPHAAVVAHAHVVDEIIYVLDGLMMFGSHRLEPGSAVLVEAMTLYSFRAGPEGVRFANFRPVASRRRILKDEFMAMRRAHGEGTASGVPCS